MDNWPPVCVYMCVWVWVRVGKQLFGYLLIGKLQFVLGHNFVLINKKAPSTANIDSDTDNNY